MSRRKIILFFIVEGISDYSAVAYALEQIFTSERVVVRITQGDITSDIYTTPQNISAKITEQIKRELGNAYKPSDFTEIVQIVDMDGVFIPQENVKYQDSDDIFYGENEILCNNVNNILKRNERKAAILNRLIGLPTVWRTIPYSVYYMSANLDHVLHNNSNLPDEDKTVLADRFALQYKNDPHGFVDYFFCKKFMVIGDYKKTWDFIKLDNNSLHRYSNFHLLFSDEAKNNSLYHQ